MSWDQLLENVAQVKHAMYAELRKVAEPMINEYLNKDHVDVDVRTVAVSQEQEWWTVTQRMPCGNLFICLWCSNCK
jgi:hypothetical protein